MLVHANTFGVATSEQRRAGRRAHRGSHHEARELSAFLGNTINVRCADGFGTKTAQIAIALVIGEDDDEVGLSSLQYSRGQQENGQSNGFEKNLQFHAGECSSRTLGPSITLNSENPERHNSPNVLPMSQYCWWVGFFVSVNLSVFRGNLREQWD